MSHSQSAIVQVAQILLELPGGQHRKRWKPSAFGNKIYLNVNLVFAVCAKTFARPTPWRTIYFHAFRCSIFAAAHDNLREVNRHRDFEGILFARTFRTRKSRKLWKRRKNCFHSCWASRANVKLKILTSALALNYRSITHRRLKP